MLLALKLLLVEQCIITACHVFKSQATHIVIKCILPIFNYIVIVAKRIPNSKITVSISLINNDISQIPQVCLFCAFFFGQ